MTFEEFEKATMEQLRKEAKDRFDTTRRTSINRPALLLEAQFYMSEIDRREGAWIAKRDFWMEAVIIFLIVGELAFSFFALREGAQQTVALQQVQASAAATTLAMTELRKEIQAENQRNYRVVLNIVADQTDKKLVVWNIGQKNINLLGKKIGTLPRSFGKGDQWAIAVNQPGYVPAPELYDELERRLGMGQTASVPFELYLRSNDGSEWVAEYRLTAKKESGIVQNGIELVSCTQRTWSR